MKDIRLTQNALREIERLLKAGSRVELQVERGRVAIVEIRRKLRVLDEPPPDEDGGA